MSNSQCPSFIFRNHLEIEHWELDIGFILLSVINVLVPQFIEFLPPGLDESSHYKPRFIGRYGLSPPQGLEDFLHCRIGIV